MNLYKFDFQHHIEVVNVQREMDKNVQAFELLIEGFEGRGKPLNIKMLNGLKCMPCQSAYEFLQWYMETSYVVSNSLSRFCRDLKPYSKKIPKRVLSRSLRVEVAYRQNYTCNACGVFPIPPNFEVDHIIELQDGGQDVSQNLQALCPGCHAEKTRLNRLRKNVIFQGQTQTQYEKFTTNVPKNSDESETATQVFSKYFSKKAL